MTTIDTATGGDQYYRERADHWLRCTVMELTGAGQTVSNYDHLREEFTVTWLKSANSSGALVPEERGTIVVAADHVLSLNRAAVALAIEELKAKCKYPVEQTSTYKFIAGGEGQSVQVDMVKDPSRPGHYTAVLPPGHSTFKTPPGPGTITVSCKMIAPDPVKIAPGSITGPRVVSRSSFRTTAEMPKSVFHRLESYARELHSEQIALGGADTSEAQLQRIRDELHGEIVRLGKLAAKVHDHVRLVGTLGRDFGRTDADHGGPMARAMREEMRGLWDAYEEHVRGL